MTVVADKNNQKLTVSNRSVIKAFRQAAAFSEIDAIQLEISSNRQSAGRNHGPAYRIVVLCKGGKTIPFHSYYSSGSGSMMKRVEKLRAFIGVGGADPDLGLGTGLMGTIQQASQMAQLEYQQQQESITGSETDEHLTNGIHWMVQTVTFGGVPVTRWFSTDYKLPNNFLFLAQKVEGQKSTPGGIVAGLSKVLYEESIHIYGFSSEDTPNITEASVLSPLEPGMEPYFSAFTSDTYLANKILNQGVIAALADWATRYPLEKHPGRNLFGQLAVLFSPSGVYVASMGTMIPEALNELSDLGVVLIKAQESTG